MKWHISNSLWPHGLHSPWNSPGQNTAVGSLSLLQEIFSTQESNPGLLPCGWILYQLSHKGSPRILEWVAYPFSRRSSQPRNRTGVFCTTGGFFTNWAIGETRWIILTDFFWVLNHHNIQCWDKSQLVKCEFLSYIFWFGLLIFSWGFLCVC